MPDLPQTVLQAWENREGPVILATVATDGTPNIIYATCVAAYGNDRLVVADNYFDKTRRNLKAGSPGAILFMAGGKSFQVKGSMEYHVDGDVFGHMKSWNPEKHPGHAAAALVVEQVFSGAAKLL